MRRAFEHAARAMDPRARSHPAVSGGGGGGGGRVPLPAKRGSDDDDDDDNDGDDDDDDDDRRRATAARAPRDARRPRRDVIDATKKRARARSRSPPRRDRVVVDDDAGTRGNDPDPAPCEPALAPRPGARPADARARATRPPRHDERSAIDRDVDASATLAMARDDRAARAEPDVRNNDAVARAKSETFKRRDRGARPRAASPSLDNSARSCDDALAPFDAAPREHDARERERVARPSARSDARGAAAEASPSRKRRALPAAKSKKAAGADADVASMSIDYADMRNAIVGGGDPRCCCLSPPLALTPVATDFASLLSLLEVEPARDDGENTKNQPEPEPPPEALFPRSDSLRSSNSGSSVGSIVPIDDLIARSVEDGMTRRGEDDLRSRSSLSLDALWSCGGGAATLDADAWYTTAGRKIAAPAFNPSTPINRRAMFTGASNALPSAAEVMRTLRCLDEAQRSYGVVAW
jgi:hypothetical protein